MQKMTAPARNGLGRRGAEERRPAAQAGARYEREHARAAARYDTYQTKRAAAGSEFTAADMPGISLVVGHR